MMCMVDFQDDVSGRFEYFNCCCICQVTFLTGDCKERIELNLLQSSAVHKATVFTGEVKQHNPIIGSKHYVKLVA